jgi:hypothetical protein
MVLSTLTVIDHSVVSAVRLRQFHLAHLVAQASMGLEVFAESLDHQKQRQITRRN